MSSPTQRVLQIKKDGSYTSASILKVRLAI